MIVGDFHMEVRILIDIPPGVTREAAAKMLGFNGINMPLGLLRNVRRVDIEAIDGPAPAGETGGGLSLV